METKKELVMSRLLDAPRELVFDAWTDPEKVKQWWGPSGVFIPTCELDVHVGGRLYIVMEAGEELGQAKGMQWPMEGEYVELDPPHKIVFNSNAANNGTIIFEHQTTITFEEEGEKTRMNVHVEITKTYPGAEFAIAGMEQGWNSQFDKLTKFIAKN